MTAAKINWRAPVLAAVMSLAGCASTPPVQELDIAVWQDLVSQQRYRSALLLLQERAVIPEQRQKLLKITEHSARVARQSLLREAQEIAKAGDYARADQMLREAEAEQLGVAEIQTVRAQLQRRLALKAEKALAAIYLLKGRQLLVERKHLQQLGSLAAAADAEHLLIENDRSQERAGSRLLQAGKKALKRGDYADAIEFLSMATELGAGDKAKMPLQEAKQGNAIIANRKRDAIEKARLKVYDELSSSIREALEAEAYARALERLDQLERLAVEPAETAELKRSVETAVTEFTKREMAEGDQQYAEGRIEQAVGHWKAAYEIDPHDELAARIAKGERFLERYRELKKPAS